MVRDFLVLVTLKNGINSFDDGPNKTGIIIVVSENSGPLVTGVAASGQLQFSFGSEKSR